MLRIRPYKPCDAETIAGWCQDRLAFNRWGGSHFGSFPISAEEINRKYFKENGGCTQPDNFYPMTAFDETGVVGHFIMRYIHNDNKILRFGWVIVDSSKRGKGYGKEMLQLGLKYAFEILKVDKVTIGVFENNNVAYKCYTGIGFREAYMEDEEFAMVDDERWDIIELEIDSETWNSKIGG